MGAKILLVDDEIEICRSIKRLLRRYELEVAYTVSPTEALTMLESEVYAIVISDYRMPEMFGTEFLAEVARRSPRSLRLMLSACAEIDTLAKTYNEGQILRFIRKPWNDREIVANLLTLLAGTGTTPAPAELSVAAIEACQQRVW